MDFKILVIGFVVFSMFLGCAAPVVPPEEQNGTDTTEAQGGLSKLSSMDELKAFLDSRQMQRQAYYDYDMIAMPMMAAAEKSAGADDGGSSTNDYSGTNVQVEGVDEPDTVKTDGEYIYTLSGGTLVIMRAYPAENAMIVSELDLEGSPDGFFVDDDALVVFSRMYGGYEDSPMRCGDSKCPSYYYGRSYTRITHYDISDRKDPEVVRTIDVEGDYFDSRMIGRYVYAIVDKYAYYYGEEDEGISPPQLMVEGQEADASFPDIYYPDIPAYSYRFSTVVSIDLDEAADKPESKIYLMGDSSQMYVSQDNIYLVHRTYPEMPVPLVEQVAAKVAPGIMPYPYPDAEDMSAIHRISIDEGKIEYKASGEVPGWVLNQFSMDESDGYFRIATTTGHVARMAGQATSENNVYVLDMDMEVVGELEDLAPGEQIYSARFMGSRCYLVTFRKIDPLFVIDLSEPESPEVLGKLKIPGYSDYLHPYDETHLIGLGKEAIPADEGDFSWYQGVKLSLFDVSDVEKPKEISKFEIGERGTDSYALHDHKAFLFSKERGLLVIPILLAEIDPEQYPQGVEPYQYGDYTFQGAYVFHVDTEDGFGLEGRISHQDDLGDFEKSGHYWGSGSDVERSLYIEDVLYTISQSKVKMNSLEDLAELNEVELPYEEYYPMYDYYE